jgi:hypothetical protein
LPVASITTRPGEVSQRRPGRYIRHEVADAPREQPFADRVSQRQRGARDERAQAAVARGVAHNLPATHASRYRTRPFVPTLALTNVGGRDDRRVWRGDGLGRPTVS